MSANNKLRVGLLGCGGFANRHAQTVMAMHEQLHFTAFCDRNEHKAAEFARQYGPDAKILTDHHALFDAVDLDLLLICLPPFAHSDEVMLAAERGIHLLIEKPIALSSELAWQMVDAAEAAGIKTQVGFMYRFGAAVEHFKAEIEDGTAGPVGLMSARYFCNHLHAPWWRMKDKSGGQVVEQVIHLFDLLRYFMGEPTSVYSRQENLFHQEVPDYTVEDISATVVNFEHGGIGVICASNNAIPNKWMHDYRIVARSAMADFANANNAVIHRTGNAESEVHEISSERDFFRAEMEDLLNAIRTGGMTRTPMREGAKSLDLVLAARRSAETGLVEPVGRSETA